MILSNFFISFNNNANSKKKFRLPECVFFRCFWELAAQWFLFKKALAMSGFEGSRRWFCYDHWEKFPGELVISVSEKRLRLLVTWKSFSFRYQDLEKGSQKFQEMVLCKALWRHNFPLKVSQKKILKAWKIRDVTARKQYNDPGHSKNTLNIIQEPLQRRHQFLLKSFFLSLSFWTSLTRVMCLPVSKIEGRFINRHL